MASHIIDCKVKVTYKWPTVVATLILFACLFGEKKQKTYPFKKKKGFHIFNDGVAAADFFLKGWTGIESGSLLQKVRY